MHEALLWSTEGDRVRCELCPHECSIAEGDRGWCGARGVEHGRLIAYTYGLVSSVAIDPIEKKPVFHYCPGSEVLSLGSVGCSMRCGHCQNWQISRPKGDDGSVPLRTIEPESVIATALREGCPGIAYTYNEPVIWLEYVLDTGRLARSNGLFNVMVTNGYVTAAGLDAFAEVIDVWRVDIKGFSEKAVRALCHVGHADVIRVQAVRARHVHGMHVECVTNVVPGVNDSDDELRDIARWIASELGPQTPWHVTRFIPYLDFAGEVPTPLATLKRAAAIGRDEGLAFVFLGNVDEPGSEDTVCPTCGTLAVRRAGFSAVCQGLSRDGRCATCGGDLGIRLQGCGATSDDGARDLPDA
ncbi:MAG: AmmeMemoRadiSam system radical SAM enzyme [Coriobacteriia bacterium]|nr:AmmeMemoRadiSam system radical SAM enzyme [Coriobacteriia bacterium]